jgi:HK97 family phage major capsid protein
MPLVIPAKRASARAGTQGHTLTLLNGLSHMPTLETKSASASDGDVNAAFAEFMHAFEAFKDSNDERLRELERRGSADVVTADKVDRLNRALDETKRVVDDLALKSARPHLGSPTHRSAGNHQHKVAFDAYVRKGEDAGMRAFESKALSVGSGTDGGHLVPVEIERAVNRAVRDVSPIRAIAGIRQVSASVYRKPFAITGAEAGWVAETAARPETDSPTLSALSEMQFPTMELYAMPAATSALLDDSAVDIEQWIAEEVRDSFAGQEGTAFISGNGTTQPKGLLTYTKVANASWSWGNIGFITTGVNGAFATASTTVNPADKLIDLVYAVKAGYRGNGTFVFNRATQAVIRKMKDAEGDYVWQPATKAGEPSMLMGYPVAESEDMPAIATDSYSVAFGDFRRGYLVVDRVGIRILRDPYSAKPYVLFYTTKRVGGGVQDFDAIKLLKFSA